MPGCCGGSNAAKKILQAKQVFGGAPAIEIPEGETVRIEYFGPRSGAVTFFGKSGKRYQLGNNTINRYADVDPQDAPMFLGMEGFRAINRAVQAPGVPDVPQPIPATAMPDEKVNPPDTMKLEQKSSGQVESGIIEPTAAKPVARRRSTKSR